MPRAGLCRGWVSAQPLMGICATVMRHSCGLLLGNLGE